MTFVPPLPLFSTATPILPTTSKLRETITVLPTLIRRSLPSPETTKTLLLRTEEPTTLTTRGTLSLPRPAVTETMLTIRESYFVCETG